MKKYLPFLFAILPLASIAQTSAPWLTGPSPIDKGTLNVGVGFGSGQQDNGWETSLHFAPRLQYFIASGWSVALDGRYEQKKASRNYFLGGGLSTRIYFFQSRRLGVFGQAGAALGQTRNYDDLWFCGVGLTESQLRQTHIKSVDLQAAASAGLQYSLCRRLSVEAGVERVLFDSRFGGAYGCGTGLAKSWRANVGVNYRLR